MPIRPINFLTIRPHHGSQHNGFEEFCCQLAALDTSLGTPFHRKGIGADAGLECYRVEPDGSETGWQAKYFFKFGSSEVSQLAESLKQAITGHPNLKRFIVCLPIDLSDGRVGKRKSQRDLWDDWKVACVNTIAPRSLTIELWGAFQLTERLSRSDVLHAGRRAFWFDDIQFSQSWFRSRFERARAALGRRYTPELNVELPIRRTLAAFARDPMLARDVEHCADRLDEALRSALRPMRDALTGTTDTDIDRLQELVRGASIAIRSAPLGPADDLPLTKWRSALTAALSSAVSCIESIWNLPQEEGRAREKTSAARHYAWRLHETLTEVDEKLASPAFQLANPRRLLVAGEAGVGKSHLLADVAKNHIEQGLPAILVLGAWFSDGDPWAQITEQLGLTTTPPDEILGALDAAAEAAGTRALIMIDAINERQGIAVWSARLGAFLEVAASFPRVAIVVSCRTTYLPYIISDRLDEKDLPRIKHPGFAGHAAEAARRYLDQRGVVRMAAPHLAPEFENPLFLRTCCDLLERRGERELPRGLAGVTSIFEFYFGAIAETLTHRMGLDARLRIVERALNALTQRMVEAGIGYLPIQEVIALVEGIHPSHGRQEQSLLFQLENEGVIAIEPVKHDATIEEQVRFTFERMSDHRIAARLLEHHVGNAGPAPALAAGGPLHEYVAGPDSHRFAGIAEALSVQLPERYGVELMDLVQKNGARWDLWHAFEVSLLWRRQETFTRRTLELVSEMERRLGRDILLSILLSITTEPTNMFNADHLDRKLREFTMPERDVRWSTRVSRVAEEEDEHDPVGTLIEWTLANGLESMDEARARLAATALAWLLSLSHRAVRDRATKALATLLVNRPNLAAALG